MNNEFFAAPMMNSLVCVWRSTGKPGTPLVCAWIQAGTAQIHAVVVESPSPENGGLRLCA
jgi:hypothetical protein